MNLSAETLRGLQDVTHAAGNDEFRPNLMGVEIVVLKDSLRATATNAAVLARRYFGMEAPNEMVGESIVVEAKELRRVAQMILWTGQNASLSFGDGFMKFEWSRGNWRISEYPEKWPTVSIDGILSGVKTNKTNRVTVDPRQLEKLARALGFWNQRKEGIRLIFGGEFEPVRIEGKYQRTVGPNDIGLFMPMKWYD